MLHTRIFSATSKDRSITIRGREDAKSTTVTLNDIHRMV